SKPNKCLCILVQLTRDRKLLDRLRTLSHQRKYPAQEKMSNPKVGIASRNLSQVVARTIKVAGEIIAMASQSRSYHRREWIELACVFQLFNRCRVFADT